MNELLDAKSKINMMMVYWKPGESIQDYGLGIEADPYGNRSDSFTDHS